MKIKKIAVTSIAWMLAATMMLSGCSNTSTESVSAGSTTVSDTAQAGEDIPVEKNDLTASEVIKLMGNGINLGNTMEAYGHPTYVQGGDPTNFENLWGQPTTTQEMIDGMKAAGFDSIRVPVAWTNGMNFESGDYTIDERLMNRVEEIVNYALNADMYVVINDHWDGGWWGMFGSEDQAVRDKAMEMYKSMWTQIGENFADYDYRLIFEGANEELGDRLNDKEITGSKGVLTQNECYEKALEINQAFVDTIRSLGGNNAERFLLAAGYNTDIMMTCDDRFVMPTDTADSKLLLSVHYYTPWDYCGTDGVTQWGSPDDYEEQNRLFKMMTKYSDQGYGIIIGEYAVMSSSGAIKKDTDKFYTNLLDNCDLYNFCPMLWDCSTFYKRRSGITSDETIAEIFSSRSYAAQSSLSDEEIKANAETSMADALVAAEEMANKDVSVPASDDYAVAWIMYQSGDWNTAYSVGDSYDPTNKTVGVKDANVIVEGAGTYTVSLDLSEVKAYGVAFSALGISHGETMFPGYTVTIDKIMINNSPIVLAGKEFTTSDDGKCTRVNLFNQWVSSPPPEARTADGNLDGCSAQIMPIDGKERVNSISITFTYTAP